jgi:two-component system chemotaxis response regulator CheY
MPIDKSMNVLIVDDYKTMLRIIRNLLKQIEFNNVEEASDGAEALAKLRRQFRSGDQRLEHGADDRLATAAGGAGGRHIAAKQAGVSNYIVKPFNAETLKDKIEKVLGHG